MDPEIPPARAVRFAAEAVQNPIEGSEKDAAGSMGGKAGGRGSFVRSITSILYN